MKLSISWIFDHINADWRKQDIDFIAAQFNKISAEIEDYYKVKFNLNNFAAAKVIGQDDQNFKLSIPEWKKEVELQNRGQASVFMVTNKDGDICYASLNDFNLLKEGLIPALDIQDNDLSGGWKKNFEDEDVIIEVDNKSITHRPDMWGHRGFAREIAAYMDLEFLSESKFLAQREVFDFDKIAKATKTNPISIEIDSPKACNRFAGIYFDKIENKPSNPFIVSRLLKVEARPIDLIVDLTNYLTLDWSQPVHAYDASKIDGNKIVVRMAKKDEKLKLLDESDLILTNDDLVIADSKKPLCLGGVMGGFYSGINKNTKSLFFESANFDSPFIRRTALRHKVRTESSMRFEKTLDPNQNIQGILRFLNLLKTYNVKFNVADEILSVGAWAKEINMQISHEFFEKRSGFELQDYEITVPLKRLGFKVEMDEIKAEKQKKSKLVYSITIPTFRSSKDVQTKEDILEEVIRFYGFDNIKPILPVLEKQPVDLVSMFRVREIKRFFVDVANMTEQQNYIFLNELFLKSIGLEINNIAANVVNPVSADQFRLINSLIPGLFKNIQDNFMHQDSLRFFEFARIWKPGKKDEIIEHKSLAGIIFEKKQPVDFYDCKSYLTESLSLIGINFKYTEWRQVKTSTNNWAMPYQTAEIFYEGEKIGIAGKVESLFLSKLDVLPESDAFFFELDGDFLLSYEAKIKKFVSLSKFQETFFDLSLFVPLTLTTAELEKILLKSDKLISNVQLVDFFEKEDWPDKRSLTFRLTVTPKEKTLEKQEIESIWQNAINDAQKLGAKLRD
jgi:phenylalanyl-tRNA synthetase beta chain